MISQQIRTVLACLALLAAGAAKAADTRHFSFAYVLPHGSGYGITADLFAEQITRLSNGTMMIDQFPDGQLGQEPQEMQKVLAGEIDFIVIATANAATVSPQAGVMSLHYLFRSEDHVRRALANPEVVATIRTIFAEATPAAHVLTVGTFGLRDLYGKREIRRVEDLHGMRVRVQSTATEDTIFPAYGAETVHMPFGRVYTALQAGVIDMAENGPNVYLISKQYEVAPILSLTEHEADTNLLWVSDRVWKSLSEEQRSWVQQAADEVSRQQPGRAFALAHESLARLQRMGIKVISDVDKSGFIRIAEPIQDRLAAELGPLAVKLLGLCRALQ